MATFNAGRKFGVEIEVTTRFGAEELAVAINEEFVYSGIDQICRAEGYNHTTRSHWKIVSDATVQGWEIVSPPMKGLNAKFEVLAVCNALNNMGVSVDTTTGLHVHHDAADLSGKDLGGIMTLYSAFQDTINFLVAPSRRANFDWTAPLNFDEITDRGSDKFKNNSRDAVYSKMRNRLGARAIRYSTVNMMALQAHGTVEFRQHQGTTDATKIWNWILLTQAIVEAAKQNSRMPVKVTGQQGSRNKFQAFRRVIKLNACDNNNDPMSLIFEDAFKFFNKRFTHFTKQAHVNPNTLQLEVRA